MINRKTLLSDLQSVLRQLEADLIQRSSSPDVPEVGAWLQAEFAKASAAKRTVETAEEFGRTATELQRASLVLRQSVGAFTLADAPK